VSKWRDIVEAALHKAYYTNNPNWGKIFDYYESRYLNPNRDYFYDRPLGIPYTKEVKSKQIVEDYVAGLKQITSDFEKEALLTNLTTEDLAVLETLLTRDTLQDFKHWISSINFQDQQIQRYTLLALERYLNE
jgi:hypothetical protein